VDGVKTPTKKKKKKKGVSRKEYPILPR